MFAVFLSDSAQQLTADIIKLFSDGFMGATELTGKFARAGHPLECALYKADDRDAQYIGEF